MKNYSVIFVCLGNICRSPTAEGMFRQVVAQARLHERIRIDSAGTHAYHVGEPPDARAQQVAARRGVDLSALRGRQLTKADLDEFDFVLAMDRSNLADIQTLAGDHQREKITLFMDFGDRFDEPEVPDPYYGGAKGFEQMLDLITDAAQGLLKHIQQRL